jgi:hypothetical protein
MRFVLYRNRKKIVNDFVQVVDYRESQLVEDFLERKFQEVPFDTILDAVGS